jgi:hypothetical protein
MLSINPPGLLQSTVNAASITSVPAAPTADSDPLEWNLLLAASCADPRKAELTRVRELMAEPVNWEKAIRLADENGTSSLVYQNLVRAGGVPAAVLESFRQRHETNIRKSLFLASELTRVLECIDSLGVDAIPYKGVVLSEGYYGDMAMRQSGDLDIFVRAGDLAKIKRAVCDLGYTPRASVPQGAENDYIASRYECTFDSPAGKNLLELQWALQPRYYAVDFDMEGLFARAVNVTVAGRSVKTPAPEDLLLVLSVHAAKHAWRKLIWLCDIAQILKRDKLDWSTVQSRARELGIARILHITLLLASKFFLRPIPAPIEHAVVADRAASSLAHEIASRMSRGVFYNEQQVSYFRLMMRLRERRADQLRFLARLTFTPGPGEWEAIRLPKVLFPLYRVVRLGRLASRLARG